MNEGRCDLRAFDGREDEAPTEQEKSKPNDGPSGELDGIDVFGYKKSALESFGDDRGSVLVVSSNNTCSNSGGFASF